MIDDEFVELEFDKYFIQNTEIYKIYPKSVMFHWNEISEMGCVGSLEIVHEFLIFIWIGNSFARFFFKIM
jgi:hypothetical protein